jgi:predicted small secreted protein
LNASRGLGLLPLMQMRTKALATVALIAAALTLSACSPEELAKNAADAAACTALSSSLEGLSAAYRDGLVDSGVLAQLDAIVGESARGLLSTGFGQDVVALGEALAQTDTSQEAQAKVSQLTGSIAERCGELGINVGE